MFWLTKKWKQKMHVQMSTILLKLESCNIRTKNKIIPRCLNWSSACRVNSLIIWTSQCNEKNIYWTEPWRSIQSKINSPKLCKMVNQWWKIHHMQRPSVLSWTNRAFLLLYNNEHLLAEPFKLFLWAIQNIRSYYFSGDCSKNEHNRKVNNRYIA